MATNAGSPRAESDESPADEEPLQLALVHYDDSPDRCTLSSRDVDRDGLLTHWLSADAALLVPLASMR